MNVAIYTRVSTENQKENGFSLQDQERRLIVHCKKVGKTVIKHYQDDCSGKNFNRPQFENLLNDLKQKKLKIKELWCIRIDRFSRHTLSTLNMIEKLKTFGVNIRFIENDLDLTIPENLIAYMLNMVMPQVENERRGLNTRAGMRQALREGNWVWKAPKGYKNNTIDKTIELSDDAVFIKKAFSEVALNLKPLEIIRKELVSEGFVCSKQQFYNLLRNPFYKGKIKINEWKEEVEEIVEGNHKAIISSELFNKVQNILSGNSRKQSKPKKNNAKFPLRGHLICNTCGKNLTASSPKGRNKRYHYYHCQKDCKESFPSEKANNQFINHLSQLSITPSIAQLYKEIIKDVFKNKESSKEEQLKKLEVNLNQLKLNTLDDGFTSGNINSDDYNRMVNNLKEQQSNIENKMEQVKNQDTNLDKYFDYGLYLLTNLDYHFKKAPIQVKHKIVGSIFPEKLIYSNNNYRTTKLNSFVALITSKTNKLERFGNKKATISSGLSNVAPPLGLEPRTL